MFAGVQPVFGAVSPEQKHLSLQGASLAAEAPSVAFLLQKVEVQGGHLWLVGQLLAATAAAGSKLARGLSHAHVRLQA